MQHKILESIDYASYFSVDADDRAVIEEFNFDIFDSLRQIFSEGEINKLKSLNNDYSKRLEESSNTIIKKETERLTIDLSWKSSKLEGNTYSLLDTERLIKAQETSEGHNIQEALMILNHKKALDYVFENKEEYKTLTLAKINKLHSLLVEGLEIQTGLRKKRIGIFGTKYKPLGEENKIENAMTSLVDLINQENFAPSKALLSLAMISYIQAFEDGNKRTARILASALLLAHNYCPLSYRSVDDYEYKLATILFYEQNNLSFLKKLFMNQFEFAVKTYF